MADHPVQLDLPDNPTTEDIENERVFRQILVDTLDKEADNYEDQRRVEEEKIRQLDEMLGINEEMLSPVGLSQDMLSPDMLSPGAMSQGTLSQESWTPVQPHFGGEVFGQTELSGMGQNGGNGDLNWLLDPMWDQEVARQESTLPSSLSLPTFTANVDTMSRKRPHDDVASSPTYAYPVNKSMRPSPAGSPPGSNTGATSPGSESSLEILEQAFAQEHGWQFGATPSDTKYATLLSQQREAEAQAQRRAAQRKAQLDRDRALAASLQSSTPFNRQFGGNSSQAVLNRDGSFRRPNQRIPVKSEASHSNSFLKTELSNCTPSSFSTPATGYGMNNEIKPFKAEQSHTPSGPSWNMRGNVYSIDSDSESSDLEEIDAQQFTMSSRNRQQSMQKANTSVYQHHMNPMGYNNQGPMHPLPQQSMINNGTQTLQSGSNGYTPYQNGTPQGPYAPANTWDNESLYWDSLFKSTNSFTGGFQDSFASLPNMVNLGNPYGSNKTSQPGRAMPGAFPGSFGGMVNGSGLGPSVGPSGVITLDDDDDDNLQPSAAYNYMYSDSSKTAEEIKLLIENIAAGGEVPPEMRGNAPEAMAGPLFEHQKIGLKWLKEKEEGSAKGGILADDMGLGKTIQAIALMAARPSEDPARKTTLIVAPVALIRQWEAEIRDKLRPTHALKVHKHHGGSKKTTFRDLRQYDVVLTTFGTLASEFKKKEHWDKVLKNNPHALPQSSEALTLIGDDCKWYRVIIDEAQCIKNKGTNTAKAAYLLQALCRWCMTGTPMMNNVSELYSLIHFCRIPPYNNPTKFKNEISSPLGSSHTYSRDRAMKKLQGVIRAVMLRRTKYTQLDGRPIITIPERTTETDHVKFNEDEQDFYTALETQTQLQFNKYLKQGSVMKNYANVLVLLLRLRQCCCHPHLIRDYATAITTEVTAETMDDLARELSDDVIARIKETEGNFECPICYDGVENPAIFIPCGHDACPECFARLTDPSRAIAQGSENSEAKCPECRGKLDPKRIIDYAAFKKAHMSEEQETGLVFPGKSESNEEEANSDSNSDSDTDSEDEDEDETLNGFIVDDNTVDEESEEPRSEITLSEAGPSSLESRPQKTKKKGKRKSKGKSKVKDTKSLAQLRAEGLRNKKARRKYLRRLKKDYVTSAKIDKTLEIIGKIHETPIIAKPTEEEIPTNGEKILIFSQFTSLLDLLEIPIQDAGYNYTRYDGSMSPVDRNDSVNTFKENPNCRVMLVSLKAGNAGLNLIAASVVIILDPFWNPFIAEQAIDRAHRIGQRRKVTVHHILVPETVEDRICALQEKKRELINTALDENAGKSMGRLGVRELGYLFGVFRDPAERAE